MKQFDKDDFEKVKVFEHDFDTALNSRFCTGLSRDELTKVAEVYKGCLERNVNMSCGGCVLAMMTSVGRLYFSYKEDHKDDDNDTNITKVKEDEGNNKDKGKNGKRSTGRKSNNK